MAATPPKKANPKPNARRNTRKKAEPKPTDSMPVPAEDLKMLKAFHGEYVAASTEAKSRYDAMLRQIATVREEADIPEDFVLNPKTWAFEKQEDPRQAEKEAADSTDDDASDATHATDDAADPAPDDAAPTDTPEVGKPDDSPDGPPE
jgi:hypothetical protein